MIVAFLIPQREGAGPNLLRRIAYVEAIPRQGEQVVLYESDDDDDGQAWIVKWIRHSLWMSEMQREDSTHHVEVRLIEPGHWSLM